MQKENKKNPKAMSLRNKLPQGVENLNGRE